MHLVLLLFLHSCLWILLFCLSILTSCRFSFEYCFLLLHNCTIAYGSCPIDRSAGSYSIFLGRLAPKSSVSELPLNLSYTFVIFYFLIGVLFKGVCFFCVSFYNCNVWLKKYIPSVNFLWIIKSSILYSHSWSCEPKGMILVLLFFTGTLVDFQHWLCGFVTYKGILKWLPYQP